MVDRSQRQIYRALNVINKAAHEKKDHVRQLVRDRYSHLRDLLSEQKESVTEQVSKSREKVKGTFLEVDAQIHQYPWIFMAGTMLSAFLLGFLLRRRSDH